MSSIHIEQNGVTRTLSVPADETLGYNKTADITRQIMAEVDWYKPSFPPLPRTRANRAVL